MENEKRYIYSVRSVRRVVKTNIEGKGSSDIAVIPTDLTPPGSPTDLVAIPLKNGMELNWEEESSNSTSSDIIFIEESGGERVQEIE